MQANLSLEQPQDMAPSNEKQRQTMQSLAHGRRTGIYWK
jgi:hypothetical protein